MGTSATVGTTRLDGLAGAPGSLASAARPVVSLRPSNGSEKPHPRVISLMLALRPRGRNELVGPIAPAGTTLDATAGSVVAAADIFSGACQQGGTWTDDGYNVASDASCLASPAATGDVVDGGLAGQLGPLANNGGPTETQLPETDNPAIGDIPVGASVVLGATPLTLCPTVDQRKIASTPGTACTSGSVQIPGAAPALAPGAARQPPRSAPRPTALVPSTTAGPAERRRTRGST